MANAQHPQDTDPGVIQRDARADVAQDIPGRPVAVVEPPAAHLDPAYAQSTTALVHHARSAEMPPVQSTPRPANVITFDEERVRILKETIMPGATDPELDFFRIVCQRMGLDPFARQIHAVKRGGFQGSGRDRKWVDKWVYQVAIDGFRLVAERTGKYRGQETPLFCGDDGVWREVWLDKKPPRAAKVGVLRLDFDQPLYGVALWDEYVQVKDDYNDAGVKTGAKSPNAMWASKPCVMLSKVSEAIALRKAFPQELSGVYTDDEMGQAENDAAQDDGGASRRRNATSRTNAGDTARGGTSASDAPKPNYTNGDAIVFPYGPLREKGVTLNAVYQPGATRTKKGKGNAPDTVIECGGEYVVSDQRLSEAREWIAKKLRAQTDLEVSGATGGEGWLDASDVERLIEWADELRLEADHRAEIAAQRAATAASASGGPSPRGDEPAGPTTAASANGSTAPSVGPSGGKATSDTSRPKNDAPGAPEMDDASAHGTPGREQQPEGDASTGQPASLRGVRAH